MRAEVSTRLRILTWHVHGSYLYYLSHAPHDFYLPVRRGDEGYGGRAGPFPWPPNVHEIPADEVRRRAFDCVLFQSRRNYLVDQHEILSPEQRRLPRIHLEHDPPREHPTDTRHFVDDPDVVLVHVTPFNALMWDSGRTPTRVIEHGVTVPSDVRYSGELERGLVAINDLGARGRRLGADVFEQLRERVPLDLVGMRSRELAGLGEVPHDELPRFAARYRFFLHPVRWTSLGLGVLEAMMLGVPVVGLATTELVSVVENGISGFTATDPLALVPPMRRLLADPAEARRIGETGRRVAEERFGIDRFIRDWDAAFREVTGVTRARVLAAPGLTRRGAMGVAS